MSHIHFLKHGEGDMYSARSPFRIEVAADIHGPSKTRQEFADECDVNRIMARYDATGEFPFKEPSAPVYYDFVGMPDLQGALSQLYDAEEAFMRLPAIVRKEFDNDPVRFVEFAQDGANIARMREWGLAPPEKAPDAPMRVEVVNAPSIVPGAPAGSAPAAAPGS